MGRPKSVWPSTYEPWLLLNRTSTYLSIYTLYLAWRHLLWPEWGGGVRWLASPLSGWWRREQMASLDARHSSCLMREA